MESHKLKRDLYKISGAFIKIIALCSMVFIANCSTRSDGDYRDRNTYKSSPYPAPAPVRQPTNYQNPYGQYQPYYYGTPNSSSYYNPYDFQQPYGRNPYSDYDQYYVPPTQQYNTEYDSGSGNSFSGK